MIKVLAIEHRNISAVGFWRCYEPLKWVQRISKGDVNVTFAESANLGSLYGYDVLILFRPTENSQLLLMEAAKRMGIQVIVDLDDDVWNLEPGHPLYMEYTQQRNFFDRVYYTADWIWCSTPALMYAADAFGRGEVVYNAINTARLPAEPVKHGYMAAWRGKVVQHDDLMFGREWFDRVNRKYEWQFWGYVPPFDLSGTIAHFVPYKGNALEYLEAIRNARTNYIWKPLRPAKFNDAKSNIAWIEATIAGGVCVTNYAGKEMWECAMPEFDMTEQEYHEAWEKSVEEIHAKYNIILEAEKRLKSITALYYGKEIYAAG